VEKRENRENKGKDDQERMGCFLQNFPPFYLPLCPPALDTSRICMPIPLSRFHSTPSQPQVLSYIKDSIKDETGQLSFYLNKNQGALLGPIEKVVS
jgi:hypothetical protein